MQKEIDDCFNRELEENNEEALGNIDYCLRLAGDKSNSNTQTNVWQKWALMLDIDVEGGSLIPF